LRTRAIPERLRGVITTRRYTNPCLPYLTTASLAGSGDGTSQEEKRTQREEGKASDKREGKGKEKVKRRRKDWEGMGMVPYHFSTSSLG